MFNKPTPEQEALLADGKPHAECFQFDHDCMKARRIVDDLFGPWEELPPPHIEIPTPSQYLRLSFEPMLERLTVAAERIADALEKDSPTAHEDGAWRDALHPFEVPGPDGDEIPVATVSITDNLDYDVASLEPGITYGIDIHGGSGVRLKGVGGDGLVAFDGHGRTWLTVKEPCMLTVCKAVACTGDARVVLVRRAR